VRGTVPPPAGSPAPTTPSSNGADPSVDPSAAPTESPAPGAPAKGAGVIPPGGKDGNNNGQKVLGRDCTSSGLPAHNGFQESPACVSTSMGEVAAENELPSLLITKAPKTVGVGQGFQLEISTRNLVRDRFLGAAVGGYYLESSFLDENGIQRGHFHTACRILPSTNEAPDSSSTPAFFVATQDNKGGAGTSSVVIDVPATATETAGEMQCTTWAGDGSHRTPMMTKANQTPAIDSVRITVGGNAQPAQDANQVEAQQDAAQADAQQEEAAQQPDQDGAAPSQQQEAANDEPAAADDSAAADSDADDSAAAETSTSTSRQARGSGN
jgi:hypothetical protein